MTGASGFTWSEGDNFAELRRLGEAWEISYGFEATAKSGRQVVARQTTDDYADAVRQLWQIIGYYFAEPEHAERVRRDLLARADLEPGTGRYLPVPNAALLTGAGGGAAGDEEAAAEVARRERILRGEPADAPAPPPEAPKRPWWKRLGRES